MGIFTLVHAGLSCKSYALMYNTVEPPIKDSLY